MTIALDGNATAAPAHNATTGVVTLSVAENIGRIIIWVSLANSPNVTVTGIASANLTFAHRKSVNYADSPNVVLEEWYADYTSPLTSEVITASYSGVPDVTTISAAGFSDGLNALTFDSNGSLAASAANASAAAVEVAGISSNDTDGIIIAAFGDRRPATTTALPGTGYTSIDVRLNTSGVEYSFIESEYKTFTGSALSSITVPFARAAEQFAIIADVLVVDTGPVSSEPASSDKALADALSSDFLWTQEVSSDKAAADALSSDFLFAQEVSSDKAAADALSSADAISDAALAQEHSSDKALADALSSDMAGEVSSDKAVADALSSEAALSSNAALSSDSALSSEVVSSAIEEVNPPPIQIVVILSS